MAPPPSFSGLFGRVHELIYGSYNTGRVTIRTGGTTGRKVATSYDTTFFHYGGDEKAKNNSAAATLRYVYQPLNASFLARWTSKNALFHKISITDTLLKGLRIDVDSNIMESEVSARATADYSDDHIRLAASLKSTNGDAPILTLGVMGLPQPIHLGAEVTYTPESTSRLRFASLTVLQHGESLGLLRLSGTISPETDEVLTDWAARALFMHRVSASIEVGLDVEVPKDVDNWTATLAGRHRMDSQTAIKARVNNKQGAGIQVSRRVNAHTSLAVSCTMEDGRTDTTKLGCIFTHDW